MINVIPAGRDPVGAGQHRFVPSGRRVLYATKCVQDATECIQDASRRHGCVQDANECAQDATTCVHDDMGTGDERELLQGETRLVLENAAGDKLFVPRFRG